MKKLIVLALVGAAAFFVYKKKFAAQARVSSFDGVHKAHMN